MIPRKPVKETVIRTAVYCRVSTTDDRQEHSLENQVTHYRDTVGKDAEKVLVQVYYDFGISGYKENRPGFQQMMQDAEDGKFDEIITKSISRFARNTDVLLSSVRRLKTLGIGVYFELQHIHTLSQAGELMLTLYAAFAQAESEGARRHTQMAIKQKYESGNPAVYMHHSLGYTKNEDGEIVPDEGAPLVIMIYEMICDDFKVAEITNYLNSQGYLTQNHCQFTRTAVTRILRNPAYMGDYVFQRFYVNDARKLVPNHGEKPMYKIEQDHIPIISTDMWNIAQEKLDHASRKKKPTAHKALPLVDENYPYRHRLFCGICGHHLTRSVRGGRVLWECGGKKRFSKDFCSGVCATDDEIAELAPITDALYFFRDIDRGKETRLWYQTQSEWEKRHTVKPHVSSVPPLDDYNYPYRYRIYCKYCGNPLKRIITRANKIVWICDGYRRVGKAFCQGIRVPDDLLKKLPNTDKELFFGRKNISGKESIGYSYKPDERKAFVRP